MKAIDGLRVEDPYVNRMLPLDLPFSYRLLLLAVIFAVMASLHWRTDRTRWKEYVFVFAVGGVVGVAAVLNDLITSTISPAYFEIAKGLRGGDGFVGRVVALGFEAGFVVGALTAGVFLYANNPRPDHPRLSYAAMSGRMLLPAAAAVVLGYGAGLLSAFVEPALLLRWLDVVVPVHEAASYLTVAAIHAGLYLGLLLGVVFSVLTGSACCAAGGVERPSPANDTRTTNPGCDSGRA